MAPPTQGRAIVPQQLDRRDFPRPDAPWLVALFTSQHCDSCAGLFDKAKPLESDDVSVAEVEYGAQPELHRRYQIDAAPITVLADAAGVTRGVVRRRVRGARALERARRARGIRTG